MDDFAHQLAAAAARVWQADSRKEDEELAQLKLVLQCQWTLVRQYACMKASSGDPRLYWADSFRHRFKTPLPSDQRVLELLPPDAAQLVRNKYLTVTIGLSLSTYSPTTPSYDPTRPSYSPTSPSYRDTGERTWYITWTLDVHALANDKLEELKNEEAGLPPAKRAKKAEGEAEDAASNFTRAHLEAEAEIRKQVREEIATQAKDEANATTHTTTDAANAKAKKQEDAQAEKAKIRHISNGNLNFVQQRSQLAMIRSLNESSHLKGGFGEERLNQRIDSFELAFRMQGSIPEAQDLSGETLSTRKLYGLDVPLTKDFGQQCLMARRFAERGVRFMQVTHSDQKVQWDQHGNLRAGHAERAAQVDLPIAGLLSDLKARGMLDDTLVIWGGEFGRTPTVQGPKMDGRDHNPHGFTIWMAGGGVKGGFAYGSTDEYGYYAQENPVHVHDFHATLLALLGLDHEKLTYRHAGRDFRLTDVGGRVVHEIFA